MAADTDAASNTGQAPTTSERSRRTRDPWQIAARWYLALVIVLGLADSAHTLDIAHETLVAKYGGPKSRFVALPCGARLHYRDQGDPSGPLLVLVHGSNSSLHTWETWVSRLGDTFRIVSFDLPGHGLTGPIPSEDYSPDGMVKVLDEARRALRLPRFHLAGNSMGGHVAWRYTLAHPEAVDKLVLVAASGVNHLLPESEQPDIPLGFRIIRTPGLNRLAEWTTPRRVVERSTRAVFADPSRATDAMVDRYHELLLHPGNRRATRLRASASIDPRAAERLGEIKAPTLVLTGEKDVLVPRGTGPIFHQRIPGSTLIEYPNVGHLPMEEAADRSAADVRAFLLRAR